MAGPKKTKKTQTVEITSQSSIQLSKDMVDMLTPALDSIRSSLKNQTSIMQKTFDLGMENSRKAAMAKGLGQSELIGPIQPDVPGDAGAAGAAGEGSTSFMGLLGMGSLLGGLSTGLALSIGSLVGVLTGQLKAVEFYADLFTPEKIQKSFKGMKLGMAMQFELLKSSINERMLKFTTGIGQTIDNIKLRINTSISSWGTSIKNLFTVAEDSPIRKFKSSFLKITAPFTGAVTALTELLPSTDTFSKAITSIKTSVTGVGTKFSAMLEPLKGFGTKVGAIGKLVGKIFYPIAIIMTAFDTIKGAMDGYAEGGLLGGLKGAIDGFFTSLVTIPLDMVKNAVAWLLEKVGLISPETAEGVKDFSFTEMFKSMTDAIFGVIGEAVDWIKDLFSFDPERMPSFGDFLSKTILLPYTLIKNAVGYIAGLFGFDEESEAIKSFNIGEEIMKLITGVKDFVIDTFNHVVESIKGFDAMGALGDMGDMAKNFLSGILGAILPGPNSMKIQIPEVSILGAKIGGGSVNLNPIPASVYKFAGIDMVTGDKITASPSSSAASALTADASATKGGGGGSGVTVVNSAPTYVTKGGNQINQQYTMGKIFSLSQGSTAGF
jgi:hypothetical protein